MSRTRWDRRHAHPGDVREARIRALGGDLKIARETGAATNLRFALRDRQPDLFDNSKLRAKLEKKPRGTTDNEKGKGKPNGQLSRTQKRRLGMVLL